MAHTRIFARLILILTGAHDYDTMGSWYWCVVFTHKIFGFNWGQNYLATSQNCTIILRRRAKKKFCGFFSEKLLSNVRHKKQLLTFFQHLLSNVLRNYGKRFEKSQATCAKHYSIVPVRAVKRNLRSRNDCVRYRLSPILCFIKRCYDKEEFDIDRS